MAVTSSQHGLAPAGGVLDSPRARVVPGLRTVSAQDWDALLSGDGAPLSHGYLSAWENCRLAGLRSRPALAYEPGSPRPVAACPGYFYELDLVGVRLPAASSLLRPVRRLRPGFLYAHTYELGTPTPLTNPFLVADPRARKRVVMELISAALEEGDRSGAQFLLVHNFTCRHGPASDQLRRLGFACVPMLPTAVVDLPYGSFDEYLGAMRAQYRRRARQALKRSHELRVEHHREFAQLAAQLAYLWRLIYERAGELRREILTAAYFEAVSDLESSSVLLLRRPDGSIACFALLLSDHPWLSFLQCGFDAAAAHAEGSYFRLLYEIVRLGIDGGFQQVELGMTALEPKLDIGGVPIPLFAWVKHRNPVIQPLLRALAEGPLRPPQAQPRRVFKEAPPTASELVARRGLMV